jgi:Helicase associated domain
VGKPSTLTPERLDLLSSLGFVWDSHEVNWSEKFDALLAFKRAKGDCNVPSNFEDKKLATWVKCQRRQYKLYCDKRASSMTAERIDELNKIGFLWEIRIVTARKSLASVSSPTTTTISSLAGIGIED